MPAKTTFAFVACPLKKWLTATPGDSLINKIEDAVLSSWNNQ